MVDRAGSGGDPSRCSGLWALVTDRWSDRGLSRGVRRGLGRDLSGGSGEGSEQIKGSALPTPV